ncbi:MAG: ribulose-phosphate 3-epimerase [Christensenellales bacterium]
MNNERKRYVSVSTEPVKIADVPAYAKEIIESGADLLHCDIMDGVAVKQITYDHNMVKRLKKNNKKFPLDVHLMIDDTVGEVGNYIKCRPWGITVQYDYFDYEKHLIKTLKRIKRAKIKVGIAISPSVSVSYIVPYLKYLDIILIMGVMPGLGGQKLMKETLLKVKEASELRDRLKKNLIVSFDGGVTFENVEEIYNAGADMVVSGSLVHNCFSRKHAIESLRNGEPLIK